MSSARPAFSRKRAPKSAVWPSSASTSSSSSRGSMTRSSIGGGLSASGRWSAIPSSDQIEPTSSPSDSRSRAASASDHGAWTRAPNGVSTHSRQSPISSRKRSTTIDRSEGTTPVAASCSRRYVTRFRAASSSSEWSARSRSVARSSSSATSSRAVRPIASPQLVRPPHALALPERHRAGNAGRGRDQHAVARDLLDPPRRRAEQEHLALARLVDHLLVELADAPAAVHEDRRRRARGRGSCPRS